MNLHNIFLNNKNEQIKFCEALIKDIPELIKYDPNNHVHNYCYIFDQGLNSVTSLHIGLCNKDNRTSYYNIFDILNKPIDEWKCWYSKHTVLYDMCCGERIKLQPIVYNWVKQYEINLLRNYKLKKLLKKIK